MAEKSQGDKSADIFTWIVAVFTALLGWMVHRTIRPLMPKVLRPKEKGISDYASHGVFKDPDTETVENISSLYELMCVREPLAHKNDPRISEILQKYKKVLSGEIVDQDCRHMPSEYIDGKFNNDYRTYLIHQDKVQDAPWIKDEIKRIDEKSEVRDVALDYGRMLLELGFPLEVMGAAIKDERINSFEPEDWKKFVEKTNEYLKHYEPRTVYNFMDYVLDHEFFNDDTMSIFSACFENDVPLELSLELARRRITMEQAQAIITYREEIECSWEEAIHDVIEKYVEKEDKERLAQDYKNKIYGG